MAFTALNMCNKKKLTGLPYVMHLSKMAMKDLLAHQQKPNFNLKEASQKTNVAFSKLSGNKNRKLRPSLILTTKLLPAKVSLLVKVSVARVVSDVLISSMLLLIWLIFKFFT